MSCHEWVTLTLLEHVEGSMRTIGVDQVHHGRVVRHQALHVFGPRVPETLEKHLYRQGYLFLFMTTVRTNGKCAQF